MKEKKVLIVGAGLGGLSCALALARRGVSCSVFEGGSRVGGRVASYTTPEGFVIDRGFQTLLTTYPELPRCVDVGALKLAPFDSGAWIYTPQGPKIISNPLAATSKGLGAPFWPFSLSDALKIGVLVARAQGVVQDGPMGATSTAAYLKRWGFSLECREHFWEPFLTGVFLDEGLHPGHRFFLFLVKCFSRGYATVPQGGMGQLPHLMASALPGGTVALNRKVEAVGPTHITLEGGEVVTGAHVVCAFGEPPVGSSEAPGGVTTFFSLPTSFELPWGKKLVLVPRKWGLAINHIALLSAVEPTYAPPGQHLVAATVVGHITHPSPEKMMAELNTVAGANLPWKFVASTPTPSALPRVGPGARGFGVVEGVVYCGDHWSSPSINGALRSGRLAAQWMLKKMGA